MSTCNTSILGTQTLAMAGRTHGTMACCSVVLEGNPNLVCLTTLSSSHNASGVFHQQADTSRRISDPLSDSQLSVIATGGYPHCSGSGSIDSLKDSITLRSYTAEARAPGDTIMIKATQLAHAVVDNYRGRPISEKEF